MYSIRKVFGLIVVVLVVVFIFTVYRMIQDPFSESYFNSSNKKGSNGLFSNNLAEFKLLPKRKLQSRKVSPEEFGFYFFNEENQLEEDNHSKQESELDNSISSENIESLINLIKKEEDATKNRFENEIVKSGNENGMAKMRD
jgi:hypothetical protein